MAVGVGNGGMLWPQSMWDQWQWLSWHWGSSTGDALGGVPESSDTCVCNSALAPTPRDLFAMEVTSQCQ